MPYYQKLVGEKCFLSSCSDEDAEKWAEWDNDLAVTLPLGDEAYTSYSLQKEEEALADALKRQMHIFAIVDTQTGALIGRCMLFDVNQVDRTAMLGIAIGEKDYWGKGYGQDAVKLLLDYAFSLLNLNNIMLGTFSFNERAIQCYHKVGFKQIGRRRQGRIVGQRRFDVVFMDILAEDFQSVYVSRLMEADR